VAEEQYYALFPLSTYQIYVTFFLVYSIYKTLRDNIRSPQYISTRMLLQVGVEIREELELMGPSEVAADVSQEVSVITEQSAR
jgi:hypothetical protein